jgi:hypothetical protein
VSNLKLVLWSGGCDSTLALYEALLDQKLWVVDGKQLSEVRAISVVHPSVPCNGQQAVSRAKILAEFQKRGLVTRHSTVTVSNDADTPRRGKDGGSIQTQIWLGAVAPYLDDTESLNLGWIEGEFDNADHAIAAFDALQKVNGKTGKLAFPLQRRTKPEIIERLRKAELLDLCWYCEGVGDDRSADTIEASCGSCLKCIKHATALWQLEHWPHEALVAATILDK